MVLKIKHQYTEKKTGKQISETVFISKLKEEDELKNFRCIDDEANDFLWNDSKEAQKAHLGTTYLLRNEKGKIVGYITLAMGSIGAEFVDQPKPPRNYPALILAWLGVDRNEEGKKYGTTLVDFCIRLALEYREKIGCQYVTADAFADSVNFYKRLGFETPITSFKDRKTVKMYYILPID